MRYSKKREIWNGEKRERKRARQRDTEIWIIGKRALKDRQRNKIQQKISQIKRMISLNIYENINGVLIKVLIEVNLESLDVRLDIIFPERLRHSILYSGQTS